MRGWVIGSSLFIAAMCLALGAGETNSGKSAADNQTQAVAPAPGQNRALDFQVIHRQTKEPIAGADLEIRLDGDSMRDVTNAQGRCRIEYGSPPPGYLSIRVSKQGLVPMQAAWRARELRRPIPESYVLTMEPGTSIGGIIQDESGKPIVGVKVYVLVPSGTGTEVERVSVWDHYETTDAGGRWRCDIMPAKLDDVWMRLDHPDYLSDEMYGATPKPPMERLRDLTGVMVMKKGCAVTGRVLGADGQPIQWATVAQGADRFGSEYPSAQTDKDGRFEFRHARPGQMILTVQAVGHAPDLRQVLVREEAEPVEFRLERGRILRGRVTDKAGNPIAGAFVAADTWRGYRSLKWRVNTDDEGRFRWEEAPSDDVLVDMGKQGYMSVRRYSLTASDQEYTIIMPAVLRVAGRVVDKETGQPIPKFTLVPGIDWGDNRATYWERRAAQPLTDGRYELTFSEPRPGHLVRIEAEGYLPEVSRAFDDGEGQVTFDFALRKGAGLSGTVCLPEGKPAAGAEVLLCTTAQGVSLRNGRNERAFDNTSVKTGPDGRFALATQTDPFSLVVLHDQGYVLVTEDELKASSTITLRPWGRVEGEVRIGSKPGVSQDVQILFNMPSTPGAPRVFHQASAVTDKDGHFVCERVPPGRASIGREIRVGERSRRFAQTIPIEIKAGETTHVTIGGTGRPVTGKVLIPEEMKDRLDRTTTDGYVRSQASGGASSIWAFTLEPDGTFRAEDIPAGEYCVYIHAYALATVPRAFRGEQIGALTHPFTIPAMADGRSDEPLDLGVLELGAAEVSASTMGRVRSATPAPILVGKPLPDLKELNLGIAPEEINGKRLLVCFFDMDQRPSRNTVLQLAKQAGELKEKGIVTVIVQAAKADEARLKEWALQNVIAFPVGRIQGDERKVRLTWGIRSLPWLILTDKNHTVRAEGFALSELDAKVSGGDN